jgi:ABC-type sugar transport systems, permease components
VVKQLKTKNKGYFFIAPFFIAFLVFSLYPNIYTFYISLIKWDGMSFEKTFVGFSNYLRLLTDPFFYQSIINTVIMWGCAVIPQMVSALLLAVVLNSRIRGRGIFRAVYYLPNLVTPSAIGILFSFLFDTNTGSINKILLNLHIINTPVNWLIDTAASRGIISITQWWMWFGYSMIIFMAGLKNISPELYEAGRIDGANDNQLFWKITMPLLRPTILYSVLTSIIGGLQLFDIPYTFTKGLGTPDHSTMTIVMYLYNSAFANGNYGYGSAVGYGLFVLILIFIVISAKFINRNEEIE